MHQLGGCCRCVALLLLQEELYCSGTHTASALAPSVQVRGGFPPRPLQFPADGAATVGSLGIQSGDSLTVTQLPAGAAPAADVADAAAEARAPAAAAAAAAGHAFHQGLEHLTEDEQLARAIALSMGEVVPDLPPAAAPAAAAARPVAAPAAAAVPPRRAASPVRAHPTNSSSSGSAAQQGAPTAVTLPDGAAVVRRIIDSDNSCLFNAVGYVALGRTRKEAPRLR